MTTSVPDAAMGGLSGKALTVPTPALIQPSFQFTDILDLLCEARGLNILDADMNRDGNCF